MSDPTVIGGTVVAPLDHSSEPEPSALKPPKAREKLEFALPTINVIFLLMLYFLVAGTIVQEGELAVPPPLTTKASTERLPRPLLVINEDGSYLLDGEPVASVDVVSAAMEAVANPTTSSGYLNVLAPAGMAAQPFLDVLSSFSAASVPVRVVTVERPDEAAE